MRLKTTRPVLVALLAVLGLCGGCPSAPLLPPVPPPGPSIEEPPLGHVVTQAEFDSIALGSSEEALTALVGKPRRNVPLLEEGVRAYVYTAYTAADPSITAEFWIRDGLVVNKVLY